MQNSSLAHLVSLSSLFVAPLAAQVVPPQVASPGDAVMRFEANRGQWTEDVAFLARGAGYSVSLRSDRAVLGLHTPDAAGAALTLRLCGADARTVLTGHDRLPGVSHYYRGADPDRWVTGVPHFARVIGRDVWPGVDVVYRGDGTQLEYDFVVAPGVDPDVIRVAIGGADGLAIDADGNLAIDVNGGRVVQRAPVLYQDAPDGRRSVAGAFRLLDDRMIAFDVGAFDPRWPLVIDPVLVYATYFGAGSDTGINAIAAAPDGSLFVAGGISSGALPQPTIGALSGGTDAALSRFDADGNLLFSLYFGGSGDESAAGVAIDSSSWHFDEVTSTWDTGYVWIAGGTDSVDLPVTTNAYDETYNGTGDAWLAGFDLTGLSFYASYYGGPDADTCKDVECAPDGSVYLLGSTSDPGPTFPTTPGAYSRTNVSMFAGYADAFVAKFVAAGAGTADLVYATLIGSGEGDVIWDMDVDAEGNAYIAGHMMFRNYSDPLWPTTANAYRPSIRVRQNAYLDSAVMAKIAPNGNGADDLVYSSFLFPYQDGERVFGIAADDHGRAYICGIPGYNNLETTAGALAEDPSYGTAISYNDSFMMVLDTRIDGSDGLVYSTYLGGYFSDWVWAIAQSGATETEPGTIHVVGWTHWGTAPPKERNPVVPFPTTPDALRSVPELDGVDGFYARIQPAGNGTADLLYGTLLGGNSGDQAVHVAAGPDDRVHVAGTTESADFLAPHPLTGDPADSWILTWEFAPAPPGPPAAPSGLTAQGVSTSQIDLSWTDNSTDEDGFRVERSPDGSSWSWLADTAADVTSYPDTGLAPSSTWSYRVRAFNANGNSTWSNVATATTFSEGGGGDATATGESTAKGTVSGDFTDTHADDDVVEAITEGESGGKPSSRYSTLEHTWTFQVSGGTTFEVNAWCTGLADNDTFDFAWSLDGSGFTTFGNVSSTDPANVQSFYFGQTLNGTVYIRVTDTDSTPQTRDLKDTLSVDHMVIRAP